MYRDVLPQASFAFLLLITLAAILVRPKNVAMLNIVDAKPHAGRGTPECHNKRHAHAFAI